MYKCHSDNQKPLNEIGHFLVTIYFGVEFL